MMGAPPSTQVLFQARVLSASDPQLKEGAPHAATPADVALDSKSGTHPYVMDLNVNPAGLTFTHAADGSYRTQIESALVAYDAQGKTVNTLGRTLTFHLSPQQYQRLRAAGNAIPVRLALSLPAGQIALRIVVCDTASGSTGSLEVSVLVARK
jgi:hypothetical protein